MKKTYFLFFTLSLFSFYTSAQFTRYIVRFKDKAGTPFSINNPTAFLSAKAITRRTKQHIAIDESDLPVTPRYIDSVRLAGNVTILDQSKWLNQVCIQTTDAAALAKINTMSFVIATQPLRRPVNTQLTGNNKFNEEVHSIATAQSVNGVQDFYNYGNSYQQIHIHDGEYVHDKGFHGEGMSLAILDAGFYHYLSLPAFDSVRTNHQVIETYDFVSNEVSVDEDHLHGMQCFSIIAANIPGQLVGSCPKANFYLYRTEDVSGESPVEEQYWAAAAERADSIGVDVVSTSLGYTQFDNAVFNHTYADMNGHTTIIARAAGFAAKKGMIVVVAAGNEGNGLWHFITTPADADSVLTVGAVDALGIVGSFSSYGPSSDGRVKPSVASVGVSTALSSATGEIISGNGTSFATPNMAGLITCLWQAFPDFTNMEIIQAVIKSSSIYNNPNDRIGYGIPNFHAAFDDLNEQYVLRNINNFPGNTWMRVFPNPFASNFKLIIKPQRTGTGIFRLYDALGRLYVSKTITLQEGQTQLVPFDNLQPLQKGIYTLEFNDGQNKKIIKLLAQ
ncbi:MAG: S8 family serine peptidase [Ginsengibacter sp.]